jgi:hypothetical protein
MAIEGGGHHRSGEVVILPVDLLVGASDVRIGSPNPPEVFRQAIHIATPDPLPEPGGEVQARDAAGRVMVARQAGKVAMASACGVAQQVAGTGIFHGEEVTGDPKSFIPQNLSLIKGGGKWTMECFA